MNKSTKHKRQDSNRAILTGIDTHLRGQSIVLEGVSYKPTTLRQIFQDDLDATATTSNAKAQWQSSVLKERTTAAKTNTIRTALFAYLAATYGPTSQVLIDFGSAPKKTAKTAPKVKAQAIEQARATRDARHIMGKKQRAEIKAPVVTKDAAAGTTTATTGTATTTAQPQATATSAAASNGGASGTNGTAAANGASAAAKA